MENTESLLLMVLKNHYRNRSEILDRAFELIRDYSCNLQTHQKYEELLNSLHNILNDLPLKILVYLFSTVPIPTDEGATDSDFVNVMKKTHAISQNIRPILVSYLNKLSPQFVAIQENTPQTTVLEDVESEKNEIIVEEHSQQPKALLDVTMEYIYSNMDHLKDYYKNESKKAWDVPVYKCNKEERNKCYDYIRNVNQKLNWLRMIEDGYVTLDAIKEMYGVSEILMKKEQCTSRNLDELFHVDDDIWRAIERLIST